MKPGDIIQEAKITNHDPHAGYQFESDAGNGYVAFEHAGKIKLNRDGKDVFRNLVCLNDGAFAVCDYEADLIKFFYTSKGKLRKEHRDTAPEQTSAWFERWQQAAQKPLSVSCQKLRSVLNKNIPAVFKKSWCFARTARWIMPVKISHYTESVDGQFRFCPSPIVPPLPEMPPLSPFYSSDLFWKNGLLPFQYQAVIIKGHIKKPVKIFLHGALEPLKWHYNIWNHMLSGTFLSDKKERDLWTAWLNKFLPDIEEVNTIFKNCRAVKIDGGGICHHCSTDDFMRVHAQIRHLSYALWRQYVTLLESSATKHVSDVQIQYQSETDHNLSSSYAAVEIKALSEISLDDSTSIPVIMVLRGWSYDFHWNDDEAILHLNPLTCYFDKRLSGGPTRINSLPLPELRNVTKLPQ